MLIFMLTSFGQWIEYSQNESIKIEYLKQECNDLTNGTSNIYIFLKITNKTSEPIDISYNIYCIYQNGINTYQTKGESHRYFLNLASNQSVEANCETRQKKLRIYAGSMQRKGSVLKEFEVVNIEIKKSR